MKIEVLYPEICNLYGDLANIMYLKKCLPQAEIIETNLHNRPIFADHPVDLVYMGTTTENGQILALDKLIPIKDQILSQIDKGMNFLITGNAIEIFGKSIEEDGKDVVQGLGVFPGIARRSSINRFNSLFLGTFDPNKIHAEEINHKDNKQMRIVGYKSQFGHIYEADDDDILDSLALFRAERGPGLNSSVNGEGIQINNFLATYVIGPLLILNPPFTKWFIRNKLKEEIKNLAFEKEAMAAYQERVREYSDKNTGIYYYGGTSKTESEDMI